MLYMYFYCLSLTYYAGVLVRDFQHMFFRLLYGAHPGHGLYRLVNGLMELRDVS